MKTHKSKAFTLIEVMIALTIFTAIAITVSDVDSQTINAVSRMEERTLAYFVAENRYNKIKIAGGTPAIGTTKDDEDLAGLEWHLTTKITKHDFKIPGPVDIAGNIRKVEISVARMDDKEHSIVTYTGYMGG